MHSYLLVTDESISEFAKINANQHVSEILLSSAVGLSPNLPLTTVLIRVYGEV